jgi:pyruvate kinase
MPKFDLEKVALSWRRTKIVATLGPASNEHKQVRALLKAGVNVVRLNMSHGDHEGHRALFALVREVAQELNQQVAILMDLCGPKIRVGRLQGGEMWLEEKAEVTVTSRVVSGEKDGGKGLIPSQYKNIHKDVKKGHRILLDDGNLELQVLSVKDKDIRCRVIHGGLLKDHKGINLPDSTLSTPSLTEKDKKDVLLAMELEADFVALSFVRSAGDIQRLTRYMQRRGEPIPVISKIERPEAVVEIEPILTHSYGIMVARGDLGIELPAERVPIIQRDLINRARRAHVPVIVATQMLESMVENSRPTRAEVGDVANAAQTGADAVMLSAETATGKYPLLAVQTMDRVLREMERHHWQEGQFGDPVFAERRRTEYSIREAMAHGALELARDLKLQSVIIPTHSGTTARIVAAHRPTAPMVGVCFIASNCRRLSLHWGVVPVYQESSTVQDWRTVCRNIDPYCGLAKPGYTVLIVSGFHDDSKQNEPVLKVMQV